MRRADLIVAFLFALIVAAVWLFWKGHPIWGALVLSPVLIAILLMVFLVADDPVRRRIQGVRSSIARLAEIGLTSAPNAEEIAEAKALATALVGDTLSDLEKETSTDLVAALETRGPARSAVLQALARMQGHLGSPEVLAVVHRHPEEFAPGDFTSLIRLHRYSSSRGADPRLGLELARRVVRDTPPGARGEILPALILIAPSPPNPEWAEVLRPCRDEFLSGAPLSPDEYSYAEVFAWQNAWRDALS